MKNKIKNYGEIVGHGDRDSRKIVLDITEATLRHMDAYERIKSIVRLDGNILTIGTCSWDLSKKRNVYLVGAGKACNAMAMAFDEILGDRLTRGIAIVKQYANGEAAVLAVLAGNDMLITSDYQNDIPAVLAAVADGRIAESEIDAHVLRILRYKQAQGWIE